MRQACEAEESWTAGLCHLLYDAFMTDAAQHGKGRLHAEQRGAICCDVLDAWFDPSPMAIQDMAGDGLAMKTSPDVLAKPLINAIAGARQIDPHCISVGAGSSELMYRVLPGLYGDGETVVLDPTYSEYPHLLQRDGRPIRRVSLCKENGFRASVKDIVVASADASLVILVNPNNPTGQALSRLEILELRNCLQSKATLWIDEAYVDYCPPGTSVEIDACDVEGLYVLKSMSKAYALSGVRAAYIVSSKSRTQESRRRTPPWIVGTLAQAAAIAAIHDREYYSAKWAESAILLDEFASSVRDLGLNVYCGHINAILVEVPFGSTSAQWAESLAKAGLIVRTPEGMGNVLTNRFIRIGLPEPRLLSEVLRILGATRKGMVRTLHPVNGTPGHDAGVG